uniref:Uncharacterized protein n=1 Tax=Anguilla anguilla TaxID=7936 RepID=A0A0E9XEW8_ANGAN
MLFTFKSNSTPLILSLNFSIGTFARIS